MGRYHLNELVEHKQPVKEGRRLQSTDMASEPVLQQYGKTILLLRKVTLEKGSGSILPLVSSRSTAFAPPQRLLFEYVSQLNLTILG